MIFDISPFSGWKRQRRLPHFCPVHGIIQPDVCFTGFKTTSPDLTGITFPAVRSTTCFNPGNTGTVFYGAAPNANNHIQCGYIQTKICKVTFECVTHWVIVFWGTDGWNTYPTELDNENGSAQPVFWDRKKRRWNGFLSIGKVNGIGNSNTTQRYEWIGPSPFPGKSYYRIRQADEDGQFSYSPVVSVQNDAFDSIIYSNPVQEGKFAIRLGSPACEEVGLVLYHANGSQVLYYTLSGRYRIWDTGSIAW